ncbi:microtubule-associated protein tau isoform X2 [Megalobrama amblycephala]|uniref:microtubule-associated protein tau isoform X2 n=1 Tax=Megalobrama amblycephala TaxID=75352 RepID=UPI0020147FC0|nr:microtubule-associated protein tau isoform X2 [Megalobrama amblycephala]
MDQQHDFLNSSHNSHTAHYNSGDTMATSLSGMTINDHHHGNQFHKENGIAVGLKAGDCPMKEEFSEEQVDVELSKAEGTSSSEEKQCEGPQDSRSEENEDQPMPVVEVASAGGMAPTDHQRIQEQDLRSSWDGQPVHSHHRRTSVSPDRTRSLSLESEPPLTFLVRSAALEDLTSVGERIVEARAPYSDTLQEEEELSFYGNESHEEEKNLPAWASRAQATLAEPVYAPPETKEHSFTRTLPHEHMDAMGTVTEKVDAALSGVIAADEDAETEKTPTSTSGSPKGVHGSPARKSLVPVAQFKAQSKTNGDAEKRTPKNPNSKVRPSSHKTPSSIPKKSLASSSRSPSVSATSAGPKESRSRAPSSSRPHAAGTKIPAMTAVAKNGKDSPKTPETSGHSSPGTPKSPASKAAGGKPPSTGNEIKKVAVIRSTPKSPKNRSPTSLSTAAPLPDLKNVRPKVGSTDNLKHQPGGGRVQILDQKVDFSNVQAKCGSKANLKHVPGGGNVQILDQKLDLSSVQSRCGSKDNIKHVPGGGKVQILHKKIDLSNVQSKCGSKDNIRHKPGGGNIEIRSEKLDFKAQSKVGSLDNIKHVAGGGTRRREKGRGADTPQDEGFLTPDPSDTPTLSSASMSPEPILLSNPQIKIEDSN